MTTPDQADLPDEGASVPHPGRWPVRMRDLVRAAQAAGWVVAVTQGRDSGGSPYLSILAGVPPRGERKLRATWRCPANRAPGSRPSTRS